MRNIQVRNITLDTGRPKIAIPVTGTTQEEIAQQCEAIMKLPCDIIEWRVDYYLASLSNLDERIASNEVHLEIIRILDDIDYITNGMPVIFTIRTKAQGGVVSLDSYKIHDLASLAAQSELVAFVDVELFDENDNLNQVQLAKRVEEIHEFDVKVIMSYHDFGRMPSLTEINNIVKAMRTLGGDISKIAGMAKSKNDALLMLKAAKDLTEGDNDPVVMIAMGKEGMISRVAGGKFGSCITFAVGTETTAPGQVSATTLDRLLRECYAK
ncbi:MAG: type I 3-dehydroquinate dehydratase [Firmicutes bacterium]|nr:type I 3-dehydroquinate dehydratase [Bacillota bacterium]